MTEDEMTEFWNGYYAEEKAKAMPDIEVTHAGYTVKQTYAFTNGCYGQWWYDAEGKFILHALGDYRTEDELREECEHMDLFMNNLQRVE